MTEPTPSLLFSGSLHPGSLTSGCGWWLLVDKKVIAHGGAAVHQTFPSLIGLEYEGLLNGLNAAIRKNVKKIIIKSNNDFILSHLGETAAPYAQPPVYLGTVFKSTEKVRAAVDLALKVCTVYYMQYILYYVLYTLYKYP